MGAKLALRGFMGVSFGGYASQSSVKQATDHYEA